VASANTTIHQPGLNPTPQGARLASFSALTLRALRDARVRTIAFAYLFGLYAYIQPVGYRSAYPTLSDRVAFARSFANNKAVRLFYGEPHDLLSVSGYAAWRVGGTLAIFAAIFGLLAAVRALRTEEDAGRAELVLAGLVGRGGAYWAAMAGIGMGVALLWLGEFAGFVLGGLPVGGSAYLALATVSVVPVCVGVGAVASQLAPNRRLALELGGTIVAGMFLLRVVADTTSGVGWLRWLTPMGWAEELRPFASERPLVIVLSLALSALLLCAGAWMSVRRDVGTGVLAARDSSEPRLGLLSSPIAQALRAERASLMVWMIGAGAFGFVLGVLAKSSSSAGISQSLNHELAKLGSGSIVTPAGYLGFVFIFFVLTVSLFGCAQIAAVRHEESEERLETLLALPVKRNGWLAGRLLLAGLGAGAISLTAAAFTWIGAESSGLSISLGKLLEAGLNCLPVALLFLALASLAYATVPRACAGIAYGIVALTFLWDLVGDLLGAPSWLVKLTPFAHIGLVPAQAFRAADAFAMLLIACVLSLAAIWMFSQRDLIGE